MTFRIALVGNPNSGKTTLFNRLTGGNQHVGNWPGVTVDKKVGTIKGIDDAELTDLPGIYSLSPYSPEERVSRDYLSKERPDAILNIVDATNLERNLFLTLQTMDVGIPMVIALNMMDALEKSGKHVDVEGLSSELGCPVVPISALKGTGVDALVSALEEARRAGSAPRPVLLSKRVEESIDGVRELISGTVTEGSGRWEAISYLEGVEEHGPSEQASEGIKAILDSLQEEYGDDAFSILANERYARIEGIVSKNVKTDRKANEMSLSDRVDRVVTSKWLGFPIFIGVIGALFLGIIGYGDITGIGTYFTDWLNAFIEDPIQSSMEQWCVDNGVSEMLTGLLVNGVIGGVGAVLGFLPQMLVLFLALCILEDIGYMARVAFVMDRIFKHFGLSGKSFIPILVGTGCGVPGIMACRTIENDMDRKITAMTVTFIPCGAKLPVISMIAGALFGGNGLVALFSYLLGIAVILMSGIILKKVGSARGSRSHFIMELPPYHVPYAKNVIRGTLERGWGFMKKAGTIILLASVLIWFLASYDTSLNFIGNDTTDGSILATIGQAICVVFQPLGWGDNWELTVGTITGLIAKENIIGTFGTLFGIEAGDSGEGLEGILASMLTPAAGLGFLAFNLLCAPCFAAIGAMHRELGSWKSTGLAVLYQCVVAYMVAMIIYSVASLVLGTHVGTGTLIASAACAVVLVYMMVSKDPFLRKSRSCNGSDEGA